MATIGDVWLTRPMLPALAELTGKHRTTVWRWYQRRRLPAHVARLIAIAWHGRLGEIHAAWRGFSVDPRNGDLVTPDGGTVTAAEIVAAPYRRQQLEALQERIAELEAPGRQLPLL